MNVFGNGVIEGWTVSAEAAFSLSISEGFGNINFTAGRTEFPSTIDELTPNTIVYVYARIKDRTRFAEDVDFIISPTSNLNDPNFLILAEVTVGPTAIESIDNSIRQEIGFLELIKAAIRLHKHRGGSLNPSKIDLGNEVKGQLPAFRIADFDAEKITTGTFDLSRMPLLDHQDLKNIGLLTHPQLDTFVKTLETSNKELFGEISTANLLQLVLALKLIYDDPDSAFYLSTRDVDENMINEFALIPGITTNDFIDFDNSTAEINLTQHYIAGVPPTTGTSFFVNYDSALAWENAFSRENLIVVGDTVTLSFNDNDESSIVTIEGFESATAPEQLLSGTDDGGQQLLRKETLVTLDNAKILANAVESNVIEGFYSGKFSHQQSFRTQFVKEFSTAQDWSNFDTFVLHTKCLDAIHGPVKIFFFDSQNNVSTNFVVLDQDEITSNDDPASNGFEMRVVDIGQIPFRNDVKGFTIFSDDVDNPFTFYIDFINIQRAVLLPEKGTLKLRYSTSQQVTFSYIEWTSIEPPGTDIRVRARSANGTVFLTRNDFTPYLANGEVINLEGTDLEIEVEFFPDGDRITSPVLQSLRVLVLSEAEVDGFDIDTNEEFARGTGENVVLESPTALKLNTPIYVDSYYFALGNAINQIVEETTDSGDKFSQAELAIFANNSPVSPNQTFEAIESGVNRVTLPRFFEPRSVTRREGRTFLVADTFNDRILEFNENGNLVAGVGSINYEHNEKIFPIGSCIDTRTGILYIVWSKRISFKTVDVSQIVVQGNGQTIELIRDFDKILGLTSAELENINAEGQIMPINLSLQNSGLSANLPENDSFMFASSAVINTGIDTDSIFYRSISTALGIPCYIGNFAYIDGIFCPTYVEKTDDSTFLVANGTVAVPEFTTPDGVDESFTKTSTVSDIIEINSSNRIIFGSNKMKFSPFVPGKVERVDRNTLLIGGLKPIGEEGTSEDFNFRTLSGDADEKSRRKAVVNDIIFGGSTPFVGAVTVLDVRSSATTFEYTSPEGIAVSDVDIDNEGQYVVAESSFGKSGRVIKLDGAGNVVFSFGEGVYGVINDVVVQVDNTLVVST